MKKENIIEEEQREKGTDLFDKSEILLETEIEIDTQNKVDFLNIDQPLLLIIEDNTDVRNYIKGHLKEDYKLLEAFDPEILTKEQVYTRFACKELESS